MAYRAGEIVFLKAGIPYWKKIPMNVNEGFNWQIMQSDIAVLLVEMHDTHPITFWKAISSDDGSRHTKGSEVFYFSEDLLDQFIHPLFTQQADSSHGSL
jgi:hypothetical protein